MGIRGFFKWLSRQYPKIVVDVESCKEEKAKSANGEPNPNGMEFDNLYLDMNALIHTCKGPMNKRAPKNEDEIILAVFEYIDRIFAICRPRKLLYMAIDGVAPMASMVEKRSRSFKKSQAAEEKKRDIARIKEELRSKGAIVPPDEPAFFCLKPGTQLIFRLASCLHYYIHDRLNSDPGWKNIKVILSDANVPGEGEHKIMDYIRRQRAQPDHNPNTHHCLYGTDADLIMLGLATHEPNFTIIQEEFKPNQPRPCELCGQIGHELKECTGSPSQKQGKNDERSKLTGAETKFIFVRLDILHEYLENELQMHNLPSKQAIERSIDDWVFMWFFFGNDFLPNLPSLETREGTIGRLIKIYKKTVLQKGEYLTNNGTVNLTQVQLFLAELEKAGIVMSRRENYVKYQQYREKREQRETMISAGAACLGVLHKHSLWGTVATWLNQNASNEDAAAALRSMLKDGGGKAYMTGLCWVLRYYYQGCPSWKWYFPYHYAPFASDICDISDISNIDLFDKNMEPLKPMEQLMVVLSPYDRQLVPLTWQNLMTSPDSPIIDFYPKYFKIDLNGKKYAWQGVILLPFVDEKRLKKALEDVYPDMTADEKMRNTRGADRLFVGKHHPSHDFLEALYEEGGSSEAVKLDTNKTEGMGGLVWRDPHVVMTNQTLTSPVPQLEDLHDNQAICIQYSDPKFDPDYIFSAQRLKNAIIPAPTLKPEDFYSSHYRGSNTRNSSIAGRMASSGQAYGENMAGQGNGYDQQHGYQQQGGYRSSYGSGHQGRPSDNPDWRH